MAALVDFGFIILLLVAAFFMSRIDAEERKAIRQARKLDKLLHDKIRREF